VRTTLPHSGSTLFPQALTVLARVAFAATLTVDNRGGTDVYPTIQDAIDAADPNDTILVRKHSSPAGWQEDFVVNKRGLTIRGENLVTASKSYFIGDRGGGDNKINDQCGILCTIWKLIVKIFHFITFGLFEGDPVTSPTGAPTTASPVTASPTGAPTPDDGLDEVLCPDTILEGAQVQGSQIIRVVASNVIIEKLTFRYGTVEFGPSSDGSIFRANCFFPTEIDSIDSDDVTNFLVITNNQIFNEAGSSVELDCEGCTVSYNTINACDGGIVLEG
jgi:hypothetical protein